MRNGKQILDFLVSMRDMTYHVELTLEAYVEKERMSES